MKFAKWNVGLALAGCCLLAACTEETKKKLLPSFDMAVPGIKLTIPQIKFVSDKELPVGALKTPINLDSTIRANTAGTFGANAITSIRVKNVIVKVLNADAQNNLSNFETARMKIFGDTSDAEILNMRFPETYVDSIRVFPANQPEISNFLKGNSLAYNLYWKNRTTTNKPLKLRVDITFTIQ